IHISHYYATPTGTFNATILRFDFNVGHLSKVHGAVVKKCPNIIRCDVRSKRRVVLGQRSEHLNLLLLQRQDLLFNRALRDHAINHHILVLADTVCTIHRLGFNRWVPPWIQQEHVISLGQCQPEATSTQGNQKDRSITGTELLNRCPTIARRTIQIGVINIVLLQLFTKTTKERRELRKDQYTMALGQNLSQP